MTASPASSVVASAPLSRSKRPSSGWCIPSLRETAMSRRAARTRSGPRCTDQEAFSAFDLATSQPSRPNPVP
jgi:hypothetical protein